MLQILADSLRPVSFIEVKLFLTYWHAVHLPTLAQDRLILEEIVTQLFFYIGSIAMLPLALGHAETFEVDVLQIYVWMVFLGHEVPVDVSGGLLAFKNSLSLFFLLCWGWLS